jgi:hypothetical protein
LEELPHRPEELARWSRTLALAGELGHALGDQRGILVAFEQARKRCLWSFRSDLTNDLGERQIRRALAVRDAAADE